MIIPHKERTFDKNREITTYEELLERHSMKITFSDYGSRTKEEKLLHENEHDKDHHILIRNGSVPDGWERFSQYDFGHHWSVWDTSSFLELCANMNWNVLEYKDIHTNLNENEFIIVLGKQ